jgi:acyl carrier protein
METEALKSQLKSDIISSLSLINHKPEEIADDETIVGENGWDVDSIDILDLLTMVEKKYHVQVQNSNDAKKIFLNINTLTDFLQKNSPDA